MLKNFWIGNIRQKCKCTVEEGEVAKFELKLVKSKTKVHILFPHLVIEKKKGIVQ